MEANLDTAYWLGLAISVVLPVLVGLVTTRVTSAGAKAVLLLLLTALNGFLVELSQADDGYSISTAIILWGASFAIGVLTHFGLYKPTGISGIAADTGRTARPIA